MVVDVSLVPGEIVLAVEDASANLALEVVDPLVVVLLKQVVLQQVFTYELLVATLAWKLTITLLGIVMARGQVSHQMIPSVENSVALFTIDISVNFEAMKLELDLVDEGVRASLALVPLVFHLVMLLPDVFEEQEGLVEHFPTNEAALLKVDVEIRPLRSVLLKLVSPKAGAAVEDGVTNFAEKISWPVTPVFVSQVAFQDLLA